MACPNHRNAVASSCRRQKSIESVRSLNCRHIGAMAVMLFLAILAGCNRKSATADAESEAEEMRNERVRLPDVEPVNEQRPLNELENGELIQCLGHADWHVRRDAAESFLAQGEDAIPLLIEALGDENYHVRAGAAYALGQFGPAASEAADKLKSLSEEDERDAVRSAASFAYEAIAGE